MNKVTITDAMLAKLHPAQQINWQIAVLQGWSIVEESSEFLLYHHDKEYGVLRTADTAQEALEAACTSRWYDDGHQYTYNLSLAWSLMDDSLSLYKLSPREGSKAACGLFTEDSEWIGHICRISPRWRSVACTAM